MSGWLDPIPTTVLYDLGGKAAIFISLGISLALFSYVGITGGGYLVGIPVSVPHKASSASCFCGLSSVSKRLY